MNTNDYYIEAVELSQKIDRDYKRFAFCCAQVSGQRTAALAADCGYSVETIQKYRIAYWLKEEMEYESGSVLIDELWRKGSISLWRKAPELRNRYDLTLEQTYEYLQTGIEHQMTRESFSAHVDEKENDTPKWIRRLKSAIRFLAPSKHDYKSEMPPLLQTRYDQAVAVFVAELEAIAGEADPAPLGSE